MLNQSICDMCGSEIINKMCSCGEWKDAEESKDLPMKLALEEFHKMNQFSFTGDAHHLGCAFVFFRGDYNDCKAVEEFLHNRKQRPYYKIAMSKALYE